MTQSETLRILHVLRAPIGGLFRHVLDLAHGQAQRGHAVGIVAASGGNDDANQRLGSLERWLALGIHRIPMERQLGLGDMSAVWRVARCVAASRPDVLHGHGAKGGAYARLSPAGRAIRAYTPHGGSLHYGPHTPRGLIYGAAERMLRARTDLFLFESTFAWRTYQSVMGTPGAIVRVVHNGISADEFRPIAAHPEACDLIAIGELRRIKGFDTLIEAMAILERRGHKLTALIVGSGPDEQELRAQAAGRGLEANVIFAGYHPAQQAFALGRLLVVPSRAESLPYIVLEAGGAGIPMIATGVGGVPEIFGPVGGLVPPDQPIRLADAILAAVDDPTSARSRADRLRERIRSQFSQNAMVDGVLAAYDDAITAKFQRSH